MSPKVYLINLPSPFMVCDKAFLPLGLMYIHQYLREHGVNVMPIVNLAGKTPDSWSIPADGTHYGISATTPQYDLAVLAAGTIKEQTPNAVTILGGVHATAMAEECSFFFDKVVVREGEKAMLKIIEGTPDFIIEESLEKHIDNFPHPKNSSIDLENYFTKTYFHYQDKTELIDTGSLLTSRGCPQACAFCSSPGIWNRKFRMHSIPYLRGWMTHWHAYGIHSFYIEDDQVAVTQKRFDDICGLMSSGADYWKCLMRSDEVTADRAKALNASGCRQVNIGVESGSQRMLDLLSKKERVEDHEFAIKVLKDNGVGVKISLMVDLPSETQEDIDLTETFILKTKPDVTAIFDFVPYPGCRIYNEQNRFGYKNPLSTWRDYYCVRPLGESSEAKKQLVAASEYDRIVDNECKAWNDWNNRKDQK